MNPARNFGRKCGKLGMKNDGVVVALLAAAWLAGCASHSPAPVVERSSTLVEGKMPAKTSTTVASGAVATPSGDLYVVKKGDTLFSISLEHGQSYRDIAAWNNLEDPNRIQVGQQLRVAPPIAAKESEAPVAVAKPVTVIGVPIETTSDSDSRKLPAAAVAAATAVATVGDGLKHEPKGGKQPYSPEALVRMQKPEGAATQLLPVEAKPETGKPLQEKPIDKPASPPVAGDDAVDWGWPAAGKVIGNFVEGSNKGLDLSGKTGEPVLAAANGKVILVSSALRGYGNFVIVKHNASYLSVYAHNSRVLVKEEQPVNKGQKIAEIGSSDSDQPKLHFEIRRQGKPVDPAKYLPVR